jgi:hypothetical protein
MPSMMNEPGIIELKAFHAIKEQLRLWERDLQLAMQNDSE